MQLAVSRSWPWLLQSADGFTLVELLIATLIMMLVSATVGTFVWGLLSSTTNSGQRARETTQAERTMSLLSSYLVGSACVGTSGQVVSAETSTTIAVSPTAPTTTTPLYACSPAGATVATPGDNVVVQGTSTTFEFWAPSPPNGCSAASFFAGTCRFDLYYVEALASNAFIGAGTTITSTGGSGTCAAAGSFPGCDQLVIEDLSTGYSTYIGSYIRHNTLGFMYYSAPACAGASGVATAPWNNSALSVSISFTVQMAAAAPTVPFQTCLNFPNANQ